MSVFVKSSGVGEKLGIFFNEIDDTGYPIDITFKAETIPDTMFKSADVNHKLFFNLVNLEVIADTIGAHAFYSIFNNVPENGKFKIKAKTIREQAFYGVGGGGNIKNKIWISNKCETMGYRAFYSCVSQIYCEAESIPSGWDSGWTSANVTYGVSETEFDAL